MTTVEATEVIRQRVLGDWLDVLTQLEREKDFTNEAGEALSKEFCEKLKITSLEIRVSLKELSQQCKGQPDGERKDDKPSLKSLKLVS